jgi:hypothetical protein
LIPPAGYGCWHRIVGFSSHPLVVLRLSLLSSLMCFYLFTPLAHGELHGGLEASARRFFLSSLLLGQASAMELGTGSFVYWERFRRSVIFSFCCLSGLGTQSHYLLLLVLLIYALPVSPVTFCLPFNVVFPPPLSRWLSRRVRPGYHSKHHACAGRSAKRVSLGHHIERRRTAGPFTISMVG